MINDQWVLLWSQSQGCFHIEPFKEMRRANIEAFRENRRMDYVTLHVGEADECRATADWLKPILEERRRAEDEARWKAEMEAAR